MNDNLLIILGSSSGFPQSNRASSGYLLRSNDRCTLIDCGGGVTSSFLRTGHDPLSVDRIFISHTHADHVCELPLFIQLVYLSGRTEALEIYLPSEFVDLFKKYLTAVYLIRERMPFELKIIGYESGFELDCGFKLAAFQTRHLEKYKPEVESLKLPNKMQCHCFVIEVGQKKIFYSSDIASFDDIVRHLDGCTYAIVESTHIDIENLLQSAPGIEAGKFILTHLGKPKEVENIRKLIAKSGLDNIVLAEDGMELVI